MFTIFCTAKPFVGHDKITQTNALRSWARLSPRPQILLMGKEEGYEEAAAATGATLVPEVEHNEHGTPLLSSMFAKADELATFPLVCYLDADIVLLDDFVAAAARVAKLRKPFLMIGQSWALDQRTPVEFGDARWQDDVRTRAQAGGRTHGGIWGMDYFLYPRGLFAGFPPFAVGRPSWDSWFVWHARTRGITVIDATRVVHSIHQDHDYNHKGGFEAVWHGPEAQRSKELVGSDTRNFGVGDATHVLTPRRMRPAFEWSYVLRRIHKFPVVNPRFGFLHRPIDGLRALTKPVRNRFGITMGHVSRRRPK